MPQTYSRQVEGGHVPDSNYKSRFWPRQLFAVTNRCEESERALGLGPGRQTGEWELSRRNRDVRPRGWGSGSSREGTAEPGTRRRIDIQLPEERVHLATVLELLLHHVPNDRPQVHPHLEGLAVSTLSTNR